MKRALYLNKRYIPWGVLNHKTLKNETVVLEKYNEINSSIGPVFHCKNLFVDSCDKDFVYFFINKKFFPNVRKLYLASNPCSPEVLWRDFDTIYLTEIFSHYKNQWANNYKNVKIIPNNEFFYELQDYVPEKIILEKEHELY
ncbi:hypothetical protein QJ850_gp120 [Acanthamoeba polyphaga mimivirus]|uniref:Uncharacterized protein n=1 Tax=Acanthamoeba polyphaga mimivirus Kroon TaxID=3069720 RepID=A0A0G2Y7Q2_9VIRU|nr:hypothetical protein QJ850_gp120 [Acanthamoeba polyphaga mimivirus]AKI80579.1 hypothetical protein [Acanthamoeba polyphaga mimivirus Kroon]